MIGRKPDAPDADDTGASPAPFLIALGIIVLVVIGIWLMTALRGGGEDQNRQAVIRAVVGQNDALQRQDFTAYGNFTCAQLVGTEAELQSRQRTSTGARGARFVDDVSGVSVDGDRATAKAVYYFDNARDDKVDAELTVVREDGSWRVCSPTPA